MGLSTARNLSIRAVIMKPDSPVGNNNERARGVASDYGNARGDGDDYGPRQVR